MSKRIIWGIILTLAGLILLLDQFNYLEFGDLIVTYWPSLLILMGVIGLFSRGEAKLGNLIIVALGLFFQLRNLGYIDVSIFQVLFPTLLIIIGLNIIFDRGTRKHKSEVDPEKWEKENIVYDDIVDSFTVFSGIKNSNHSKNFKGGKLTAVFGGIELDLIDAEISDKSAVLNLTAIFGGIELLIPNHWNVEVKGTPILGGIENNTRYNRDENTPTLKINGTAIFGGIEIK